MFPGVFLELSSGTPEKVPETASAFLMVGACLATGDKISRDNCDRISNHEFCNPVLDLLVI